ncbi:MAG: hypothetical protein O9972_39670 [Burkholderiales bacterium]|nr:hypothetical protein [Burkholderiales bacterium]
MATIPGYDGDTFCHLFTTAQHYDATAGDYLEPTAAKPANIHSVRARSEAGPAYVLTDHATHADAEAAAKLLAALIGIPHMTEESR